jgi:hypothetical protein
VLLSGGAGEDARLRAARGGGAIKVLLVLVLVLVLPVAVLLRVLGTLAVPRPGGGGRRFSGGLMVLRGDMRMTFCGTGNCLPRRSYSILFSSCEIAGFQLDMCCTPKKMITAGNL